MEVCLKLFLKKKHSHSVFHRLRSLRSLCVLRHTAWVYQEPGSGPSERISLDTSSVQRVFYLDTILELLVSEKRRPVWLVIITNGLDG